MLGITPPTWKKYRVPPRISAMQWMSDFVARLKQLDKLATLTTNEGVQSLRVRANQSPFDFLSFNYMYLESANMAWWLIYTRSISNCNAPMRCSNVTCFTRRACYARSYDGSAIAGGRKERKYVFDYRYFLLQYIDFVDSYVFRTI